MTEIETKLAADMRRLLGSTESQWQRINAMCELSPENLGVGKGGIDRTSSPFWRNRTD